MLQQWDSTTLLTSVPLTSHENKFIVGEMAFSQGVSHNLHIIVIRLAGPADKVRAALPRPYARTRTRYSRPD
ncbi:hypothetical protein J6590_037729 [Homalodisca vitripennis]|nr:hypothetical protein J6590_037729 [Homalodisca vitripennis]